MRTTAVRVLILCVLAAGNADAAEQVRKDYYGDPLPPGALARMGTLQMRHEGANLAFSADGKTLISAGWDATVRFWDAVTGKPLPLSLKHDSWACGCAFSRDGKLLVTSGGDGSVRLWESGTGKELRRFVIEDAKGVRRRHEVLVCYRSPDGKRLAAISSTWDDKQKASRCQMNVWDAHTGESLARRSLESGLACVSSRFTPDGASALMCGRQSLTLEDPMTGQVRATIAGDLGAPVAFSPTGELLAVGIHKTSDPQDGAYEPKGIRVMEAATGAELFHVEGWIDFVAFSPDGRVLATADPDALRLWDAVTGERLFRRSWPEGFLHRPLLTPITSFAFMPNGKAAVTGLGDGTLLVWDLTPAARPRAEAARDLDRKELDALWSDLAADARQAHRAIHTLAASPAPALPFLAEHVRPVAAIEAKRVDKLLSDLDSDRFAVRDAAAKELTRMGEQIEPALRRTLEQKPSLEVKKRIEIILVALHGVPPAETLRTLRAIRTLERIGTAEARRILRKLASGAAGAPETREAAAAVTRLARRSAATP